MEIRMKPAGTVLAALLVCVSAVAGMAQQEIRDAPNREGEVARHGDPASGSVVTPPAGPASNAAADRKAGRGGGGAERIDLVRPDDGYASLRRRAAGSALAGIAAGKKPKPLAVPTGQAIKPMVPPTTAHNAVGAVVVNGASSQDHKNAVPPHGIGPGTNSIGVGATHPVAPAGNVRPPIPPQTPGINGTTIGHIASTSGTVGGPAKPRTGINGTSFRPRH
jgi:hypothetical protein